MSPTFTGSSTTARRESSFALPRDAIRLSTNDPRIVSLAARLWAPGAPARRVDRTPLSFVIEVSAEPATVPHSLLEEWSVGADDVEFLVADALRARIECRRGQLIASVASPLVEQQPSLVARLLLETPAAVLLARRDYAVIHAGAVTGPAGAVVIRGAPGAGKSTLVAAAHKAGLDVLGDETVLVAREHPDELLAAVRDVTLLPESARLLELEPALVPAHTRREEKLRLDLFPTSRPDARRARRVATVVLGSRDSGTARLEPVSAEAFIEEFGQGGIPQEAWSGTPEHIAKSWANRSAYRLSGSADLDGAVKLLAGLVT